jgi:hypothetical protein
MAIPGWATKSIESRRAIIQNDMRTTREQAANKIMFMFSVR